jgi:flavin-dependent dehydrogenase
VLEKVGVWPALQRADFPVKRGATFVTADGSTSFRADFVRLIGSEHGAILNVERARFDEILLRHAAACGAEVREECVVTRVEPGDDAVRVTCEQGGAEGAVCAGTLIDASGRRGVLAQRDGLRRVDPGLRSVAAFSHFRGVPREAGEPAGDIRVVSRSDLAWFWFIPVSAEVMSVGVVLPRRTHERGARPEEVLARAVAETPVAAQWMTRAVPVMQARFEADFSYGVTRYAGRRWLLAGDAGSFIDPIFSTGVHLGVQAGAEAAQAILAGTRAARAAYARTQRRRYLFFRSFVNRFYQASFRDLFFRPTISDPIYRAIATVLSGNDRPGFGARLRIAQLTLLSFVQRFVPLVPRLHGDQALLSRPLVRTSHAG